MLEIKFTLDATPALIGAVRDLASAIHDAANLAPSVPAVDPCGRLTTPDRPAELREATEKGGTAEEPKKRKSRAKKVPSESNTTVAPAIDTPAEPEPSPVAGDPATVEETPAPVEETPAPVEETPAPEPEPAPVVVHLDGTDPVAGKGQTGEILAELTRKAIADLDARGVDRSEANRRIRDYCARNDIKYPTFPALLQAVGYAEAIAICKGARA